MKLAGCILLSYLLGSLSPSALLAKLKQQDLRNQGTKNLGASNTMLIMGKKWGALVMIFDIFKGYLSVKIARWLYPHIAAMGLLTGLAAVLGHVFPFYLGFRGGKGLATFGGLVLAYDLWLFLGLLTFGIILMIVFNCSVVMPMSAGALFPILAGIKAQSIVVFTLAAASGVLIIVKHWSNIEKARSGNDIRIREFIKNGFSTTKV